MKNLFSKLYFANPKFGFEKIQKPILDEIEKVILSGSYIQGSLVSKFENSFLSFLGNKGQIVSCANGTDAITIALLSYGLKGKKIIVPSHTAPATIIGILQAGCIPLYCEIDKHSFLISSNHARILLEQESDIGAILAVNLYGFSVDLISLKSLAKEYSVRLIEDCAQSTGTIFKNKMSGTIADAGTFSFFPTKNLSTIGDGGALWLPNRSVAQKARSLCQYGWNSKRIVINEYGINSRLDEIHAAILIQRLKSLKADINKRRKLAKRYDKHLKVDYIKPEFCSNQLPSYHLYVVRTQKRKALMKYMTQRGISLGIHYHPANHDNGVISSKTADLPITSLIANEVISLPLYPELDLRSQDRVIKLMNEFK